MHQNQRTEFPTESSPSPEIVAEPILKITDDLCLALQFAVLCNNGSNVECEKYDSLSIL